MCDCRDISEQSSPFYCRSPPTTSAVQQRVFILNNSHDQPTSVLLLLQQLSRSKRTVKGN
jgi:hypothetical protein